MPEGRLVLCSNHEAHFANHNNSHDRRPKQPKNLEGLMRYTLEGACRHHTAEPSSLEPKGGNRRKFLEDAVKSMSIDIIDLLKKQIHIFNYVGRVQPDTAIDVYLNAFKTILEYIDSAEIASDFHSVGGFDIFEQCMSCSHPKIRGGACDLLAEICQHNAVCQTAAIDYKLFPILLEMLDKDEDEEVTIKSLAAISCIANENQEGAHRFFQYQGLHVLKRVLPTQNEELRGKCALFLANLCYLKSEIVDVTGHLVFMGFLPILGDMLAQEHRPSHEYVAALMKSMMVHSAEVKVFCGDSKHNMRRVLEKNFEYARARDSCYDELQHLRYLLINTFSDWK